MHGRFKGTEPRFSFLISASGGLTRAGPYSISRQERTTRTLPSAYRSARQPHRGCWLEDPPPPINIFSGDRIGMSGVATGQRLSLAQIAGDVAILGIADQATAAIISRETRFGSTMPIICPHKPTIITTCPDSDFPAMVRLSGTILVLEGTGTVVEADVISTVWVHTREARRVRCQAPRLSVSLMHSSDRRGTYFVTKRSSSPRDGNAEATYVRIRVSAGFGLLFAKPQTSPSLTAIGQSAKIVRPKVALHGD